MRIVGPLYLNQHLVVSLVFTWAILVDGKWNAILVLVCIFITTNYVEHLFMCLLTIDTSLYNNSFVHFFIGHLFFCYGFIRVLYLQVKIIDICFKKISLKKYFLLVHSLSFIFFIEYFLANFLFHCGPVYPYIYTLCVFYRKTSPNPRLLNCSHKFSSMVL